MFVRDVVEAQIGDEAETLFVVSFGLTPFAAQRREIGVAFGGLVDVGEMDLVRQREGQRIDLRSPDHTDFVGAGFGGLLDRLDQVLAG